jgi:hypothetical protein
MKDMPAFPLDSYLHTEDKRECTSHGMTLRDYFAAQGYASGYAIR